MNGRRLGIFGGAFDPIHHGHLYIANAVMAIAGLDRVLFLPVGDPAHRTVCASAADRSAMVRIAIEDNERFAFDDTGLVQPSPAYTADTLALLRKRYPHDRFCFIAGSDSLVRSTWRRLPEVLAELETFYIVVRADTPAESLEAISAELSPQERNRFSTVRLPFVDISGSALRASLARGEPIRYLTPDGVAEYIRSRGLYRAKT